MEDSRQDDPVESGGLEDEAEAETERPPTQQDPVESGSLEDEDR
jgi:hypothetical protein